MTERKRLVERLVLDAGGFRAEVEFLDDASFRERVIALVASVPHMPGGLRILQVRCNGCDTTEDVSPEDPQLPAGWTERDNGEFCPACSGDGHA